MALKLLPLLLVADVQGGIDLNFDMVPFQIGQFIAARAFIGSSDTDLCDPSGVLTLPDGTILDVDFGQDCLPPGPLHFSSDHVYQITEADAVVGFACWFVAAEANGGSDAITGGFCATVLNQQMTCAPDVSGDGTVGVADLLFVVNQWGTSGPLGDTNFDGIVNVWDLLNVICNWNDGEGVCYPG